MIGFFLLIVILSISGFVTKKIPFLYKYRIPLSLTSSLFALAFFSFFPQYKASEIYTTWKAMPGDFIAIVFAALFLEVADNQSKKSNVQEVFLQILFVMIIILGQELIGIVLTVFLFKPFFGLPLSFSSILETGFAGGHGSAVIMQPIYEHYGLKSGLDFGLFSATIGLLLGTMGGIGIILKEKKNIHFANEDHIEVKLDLIEILINLGLLFSTFLLAYLSRFLIVQIDSRLSFPLFVYAILYSLLIKFILSKTNHKHLIKNEWIALTSSISMEILVFTGIATIDVKLISEALIPLLVLFTAGFLWNVFGFYYISKKFIHPEYNFEIGLINFGMFNGTTATGLMLLRMVDPDFKSRAVKIYAESAPFTSPLVGGGIISLSLPFILNNFNSYLVIFVWTLVIAILYGIGTQMYKKNTK